MNRIKSLRAEREMKQVDLAKQLQVGQNTVSNWETGRTEPDFSCLQRMSQIFNVSIDYILGHSSLRQIAPETEKLATDIGDGLDLELIELLKRVPAERLPEVERYLRFLETEGNP